MVKVTETVLLNERSKTAVPLTRMGFGTAPLGNLYRKVEEADAQAALQAAYDAGIRFIDTAPQYGLGRAEGRVGAALKRFGREQIQLSTKVGRLLEDCPPEEVVPLAIEGRKIQ